ncbi:porin [Cellvibrio sp.]|uniref:porin n=1 Tax=Cellvibrio sp. TaxID=1965322 RepID=UPI0039647914
MGAFTLPALADNFYVFGDVGQGKMEVDASGDFTLSKTDTTFSLGAGYNVNQFFAVEVAYRDLGQIKDSGMDVDDLGDSYLYSEKLSATALQASVVGKLPISEDFNIFGRVGVASIDADYKITASYPDGNNPAPIKDSESKTRALVGVGASYALTPQIALRAEYNQYAKWDDTKLSALTIGATYNF